jgi:hypothetical protein
LGLRAPPEDAKSGGDVLAHVDIRIGECPSKDLGV